MAASYISVPRDLTKVKNKVMFNLTKRQLICFGVATLIGVPSFFVLKRWLSVNTSIMIMMVIMMPLFFLAMYEKHGQPLEVYMKHFIQANFVRPKKRPYKTDNYYAALIRQAKAEEEVENIVREFEKKETERIQNAKKFKEKGTGTGQGSYTKCQKE